MNPSEEFRAPAIPFAAPSGDRSMAMLILDAEESGRPIVFASEGLESLTGYRASDAAGKTLQFLEGQETAQSASEEIDHALREAKALHLRLRHHRKDGSAFWSDLTICPIRGVSGNFSQYFATIVDVSELVEAEGVLREKFAWLSQAKHEWESTIDVLPELVLLIDSEMRILRANRAIEDWEVGTVREARGLHFHQMLHGHCLRSTCYLRQLWDRLAEAEQRQVGCNAMDPILGRRIQVTMHAVGTYELGMQLESVAIVLRDVSEHHRTEEARRRTDRFEAMGYLVGGLAHEIGNPLAAMKTTVDVWNRGFEGFDREMNLRYLARIEVGVNRLLATVRRILGGNAQGLRRDEIIPIGPELVRLAALFEDQLGESGIELVVGPLPSEELSLVGDASAVAEILANVVKNAIEACDRLGRIEIDIRDEGDIVAVSVRDTGAGIARSDLGKLFVPFYTTKATGTGIGLAHVNNLIEAMGGDVQIESSRGGGTAVTLQFRRASEEGPAEETK